MAYANVARRGDEPGGIDGLGRVGRMGCAGRDGTTLSLETGERQMLIANLPSVRRPVRFSALSFTLRILENAGLMKLPLQIEALLAAARRQTGLDDFGDETFREPLSRLLDSCKTRHT